MDDKLQTETVEIRPQRIFKCHREGYSLSRRDVTKDGDGNYHCKKCGEYVEDVTDTETGKEILRWI